MKLRVIRSQPQRLIETFGAFIEPIGLVQRASAKFQRRCTAGVRQIVALEDQIAGRQRLRRVGFQYTQRAALIRRGLAEAGSGADQQHNDAGNDRPIHEDNPCL